MAISRRKFLGSLTAAVGATTTGALTNAYAASNKQFEGHPGSLPSLIRGRQRVHFVTTGDKAL